MKKIKIFGVAILFVFILGACGLASASEEAYKTVDGSLQTNYDLIAVVESLLANIENGFFEPDSFDEHLYRIIYRLEETPAEFLSFMIDIPELFPDYCYEAAGWLCSLDQKDARENAHYKGAQQFLEMRQYISELEKEVDILLEAIEYGNISPESFDEYLTEIVLELGISGMWFYHFMINNRSLFPNYCLPDSGWPCEGERRDAFEHKIFRLIHW